MTLNIKTNKSLVLFFIFITVLVWSSLLGGIISLKAARQGLMLLSVIIESDDIDINFKEKKAVLRDDKKGNDLSFKRRHQSSEISINDAKLSFYMPFESKARFQVTGAELRFNYTMMPIETEFKAGFYTFFWQKNVLNLIRLKITDLFAYGYSIDEFKRIIFPVIIHDKELPEKIKTQRYSFVFITSQDSMVFVRIRGTKSKETLFENKIQAYGSQPFLIQWNPDDSLGNGKYYFEITTISKNSSDKFLKTFIFYHKNEISTETTKVFSGYRLEGIKDVKL